MEIHSLVGEIGECFMIVCKGYIPHDLDSGETLGIIQTQQY
jgi:hypothetical protein